MEREWIFQQCRVVQANPNGHIDIWAREHYKSTIITFGQTIQDILSSHGNDPLPEWNGREATIGIFSFNRPSAKKFLRQIKIEFESNEELKLLFPDILFQNPSKESVKWSEDEGLVVKRQSNPRESTLEASGLVDGQPTGMHYAVRVYDDVVTLESARSIEMIKKTTQAWGLSLALGSEGGHERYVGTFYADGDTYNDIIENKGAIPRIYPATDDGTVTGNPVLFSKEYLMKKTAAGMYDFSCQYLCNPIPDDNAYFSKDDFKWYDKAPENLWKGAASDYAVTEGGGDATEHGVFGVDRFNDLYILDWWTGRTTPDKWIEEQLDMAQKYKPMVWAAEGGTIRRSIEPFLTKRISERREWLRLEWVTTSGDKASKCRSFQARAKMGKVWLPRNEPWAMELVAQLIRFPKSKHDDKVDVCGIMGQILDTMQTPVPKSKPELRLVSDSYGFSEDDESEDAWKTV